MDCDRVNIHRFVKQPTPYGVGLIYAAASNIFSIKIPYPVVGSFTKTCVTAPTSFPVAVPDKIFGLTLFLDFIDRCHSLSSLTPPPAAVVSLPVLYDGAAAHE